LAIWGEILRCGIHERREETEWFNVVAWGGLAEICNKKLFKSQQVYVEGRLQTRTWEDENGQRHFRTEVVASEMIILGPRDKYRDRSGSDEDNYSDRVSYPDCLERVDD
jgi:single-strand DNA-binding protein